MFCKAREELKFRWLSDYLLSNSTSNEVLTVAVIKLFPLSLWFVALRQLRVSIPSLVLHKRKKAAQKQQMFVTFAAKLTLTAHYLTTASVQKSQTALWAFQVYRKMSLMIIFKLLTYSPKPKCRKDLKERKITNYRKHFQLILCSCSWKRNWGIAILLAG